MSGYEGFPGRDVRAKLDHPVIDADAHVVECDFAQRDFVKQIAGDRVADALDKAPHCNGPTIRGFWWGLPSGPHTADRALAQLPRYFHSRLDELGIDFAHCYTTRGLNHVYLHDEELRRAACRALNMLTAEMFADVGDRLRPVAVIPTYTPKEAIEELEFAVGLGHKAVMIGTEIRGTARRSDGPDPFLHPTQSTRSIVMDSPYDYDPFWKRCVELKVAPVCHTSGRGIGYRASPKNYVFNHLGDFATGAEFFCRSLIFAGVTRRFPELTFGFLEGGIGWAVNLLSDIVEHWEKRNADAMLKNLDPAKLDIALLGNLFEQYGGARLTKDRITATHNPNARRPEPFDDFAACELTDLRQLRDLFVKPFYFGCEADDRTVASAFNRRLSPIGSGAGLKPMFGSDIGHWDVLDATSILTEAWGLVRGKLLTEENFRDFTFTNAARMHTAVNPDYYKGTVVEGAVAKLLAS